MTILLVTTWDVTCGIAEHSGYLKQAVEAADPSMAVVPCQNVLADPLGYLPLGREGPHVLHLNYHAALHSRWTPTMVTTWRQAHPGVPIVVTYHDTGVPNSDLCKAICAVADVVVVHEPFDDLPVEKMRYWRMGVPGPQTPRHTGFQGWRDQPILGSIGFPFPWKHYEQLALLTEQIGWGLFLIAPTATAEQVAEWRRLNPHLHVRADFVPREDAIAFLAGCDATAFTYVCHNTGQSAALLQGVAARKPVLALSTCRQFRALYLDPLGREAIRWCDTFEEVAFALRTVSIERIDPGIVALAEQDGWARLGRRYATLYRSLL